MDGSDFCKVLIGHTSSLDITLYHPTGTDQTFSVSKAEFIPNSFGGTVPAIYNAGTISSGDSRITVPASITVPANSSTTVTVNADLTGPAVVQGWIKLRGAGNNNLQFAYAAQIVPSP
jgi:hypothetical protein